MNKPSSLPSPSSSVPRFFLSRILILAVLALGGCDKKPSAQPEVQEDAEAVLDRLCHMAGWGDAGAPRNLRSHPYFWSDPDIRLSQWMGLEADNIDFENPIEEAASVVCMVHTKNGVGQIEVNCNNGGIKFITKDPGINPIKVSLGDCEK
ncbi:hypothetical protein COY07_00210 [Candidatus Peregrinibacteria bacterium CG_4_10_14_0_2_um_filter_43_11]|nr:MAG: hypothetical protein COY07_00210 [Candidatus Peregrinibacteria bacterium CG_4_10_14_0_2_um_filter_43_11]